MVPQNQAPTSIPAKVALAIRPPWAVVIPNSPMMDGSANPSKSTSAPSAAHVTPQTASRRFWNLPKPIWSTASWTVVDLVVATAILLPLSRSSRPSGRRASLSRPLLALPPGPSPPTISGPVELPVTHQPHGLPVGAQRLPRRYGVADQEPEYETGDGRSSLAQHRLPDDREHVERVLAARCRDRPCGLPSRACVPARSRPLGLRSSSCGGLF